MNNTVIKSNNLAEMENVLFLLDEKAIKNNHNFIEIEEGEGSKLVFFANDFFFVIPKSVRGLRIYKLNTEMHEWSSDVCNEMRKHMEINFCDGLNIMDAFTQGVYLSDVFDSNIGLVDSILDLSKAIETLNRLIKKEFAIEINSYGNSTNTELSFIPKYIHRTYVIMKGKDFIDKDEESGEIFFHDIESAFNCIKETTGFRAVSLFDLQITNPDYFKEACSYYITNYVG